MVDNEKKKVTARFHPQAWIKRQAFDVDPDGETEFDVTVEIDRMGKEVALQIKDDSEQSDNLLHSSQSAPAWTRTWPGPYRVEVERSIREYFGEGEEPSSERYYIQDTSSYVGICAQWWRKTFSGYTNDLNEAADFSLEVATYIERTMPTNKKVRVAVARAAATLHVVGARLAAACSETNATRPEVPAAAKHTFRCIWKNCQGWTCDWLGFVRACPCGRFEKDAEAAKAAVAFISSFEVLEQERVPKPCSPDCRGWAIFERSGSGTPGFDVERCDDCDYFADDYDAFATANDWLVDHLEHPDKYPKVSPEETEVVLQPTAQDLCEKDCK